MSDQLTREDFEPKFEDRHFTIVSGISTFYLKDTVDAHFKEMRRKLENAPKVLGVTDIKGHFNYHDDNSVCHKPADTHTAFLIMIEPLKPKEVTVTREKLKNAIVEAKIDISVCDVLLSNIAEKLGL